MRAAISLALILALLAAGCGNSDEGETGASASEVATGSDYTDWPLFGRVPQRTHYLAADQKALDPPLKEDWSINTHALIEFPPAVHDGVAYVINKYGNGKAVRLSDRKVLWEINIRPSDKGKPNFVTAPVYCEGKVFGAFLTGHLVAGDAKTGKKVWVRKLDAHLESSPLAVEGASTSAPTPPTSSPSTPPTARPSGASTHPGRSKPAPATTRATSSSPTTRAACSRLTRRAASRSGAATRARCRPSVTAASTPPPQSPSATSTPPATTASSTPSTRRPARSSGTSRPATTSTARPPSPRCPAPRRPSTSAPKTAASSPSTPGPARSAGTTTSAARSPAPPRSSVTPSTPRASRPRRRPASTSTPTSPTFHLDDAGYTPMVSDGRHLFLIGYYDLIGLEPR